MKPERILEARYPWIDWRKPLVVNGRHFACRYCIALKGLKGSDVPSLPTNATSIISHIEIDHG